MLENQLKEFREFVENNSVEVFSAIYRVGYIVEQAGGQDNLTKADHKLIAQQLIFKGMPASLPGVIIDTIIPPEQSSLESEILGEELANIARANEEKVKGLYEVLDCMLTDDVEKFKTIDSVELTQTQMMKNCDFFHADKIFNNYMTQGLAKSRGSRSEEKQQAIENSLDKAYEDALRKKGIITDTHALIESQPLLLLEPPAPVKKAKKPKKSAHGHSSDYLNFDPTVESFTSNNMEKAGADASISQPLGGFLPEVRDSGSTVTSGVTTSDTIQRATTPEKGGYNFAKILLYATAAVGTGYLIYRASQNNTIVENAKEFAADAAKEVAIRALVGKEVDSKFSSRQ